MSRRRGRGPFLLALLLAAAGCSRREAIVAPAPPAAARPVVRGEAGFLKGQLHLHSGNSGDSATPPGEVVRWYEARGYDFIVFTDHDHVTAPPSTPSMLVIPGVELTQNLRRCDPPAPPGHICPLHVNALFVTPPAAGVLPWGLSGGIDRLGRYRRALDTARALGGIAQLNHPNFHDAADAPLVTALAGDGLALMEIANQAWDSNNDPPDGRPSTEALWDAVLSTGATLYGTATDDAHHYEDAAAARARGEPVFVGDLGFVMVRARKDPAAIREALVQGQFYASTGVVLGRVERTATALEIEVAADAPGPHRFTFIGRNGRLLAASDGRAASFPLAQAAGGYVRAVIRDQRGRRAWVQPVRVP
ncbi:MAG TPA: CehA/McbA family metallohydrolase [Polyangia bacterium]|nr:CehA/McbA family metallohydrolase [Polyangia bacterium]